MGSFVAQGTDRRLGLADQGLIAFGFRQLDHLQVAGRLALETAYRTDRLVEAVTLAHQALRLLGVVPEIAVFGARVQLGQAVDGPVEVKDASSAARPTA
jgi:hypothetical protein